MKLLISIFLISITISSCNKKQEIFTFENPQGTLMVQFKLSEKKSPVYKLFYKGKLILDESELGIIREDTDLSTNLKVIGVTNDRNINETYNMFHGKQEHISYQANEYIVSLENPEGNKMDIQFRLSDDGVGFRYFFPETSQETKKIKEERTTYNFNDSTRAWVQPLSKAKSGWERTNPSYEEHYLMDVAINTKSPIGEGWVYPALFKTDSTWVLISETGLGETYCGTHLQYNDTLRALQVTFPQKEEIFPGGALNPEATLPWSSPWRIIALGSLATITESTLGTDLAEPAIKMDTSVIKGGLSSWSWVLLKDDFTNYETSKKFIDYAAEMQWPYCLIDADWDQKIGYEKVKELASYAKTKNVKVLVWYNSSGDWNGTTYTPKSKLLTAEDRQQEFSKLNEIGVSGVKVDFFGGDGQSMIAYYHNILKDAAAHKLLVNFHGATLPRGWQRTYPNLMTMEAIKGEEFITFEQVNADKAPGHSTILPFTRNAFDPMDFTPMVLDSIPNIHKRTTNGFDLALPVLFLSGIQHIAEIPEGMAKQPDYVVDYLKGMPTLWDESKFIDGYPGKYVIMARKKNELWYVVGINGENTEKKLAIDLSFINNKDGIIITDGATGFIKQPVNLSTNNIVKIDMKPYGGFVMKF